MNLAPWLFWRHFAAAALGDGDMAAVVEQCSTRDLVSVSPPHGGLSVIERLLVAYDSVANSHSSSALAIRYLGGILELPSFWSDTGDATDRIIEKICSKVLVILQDLGLDSPREDEAQVNPSIFDYSGVDLLADTLVEGIQRWGGHRRTQDEIMHKIWYPSFSAFVQLLRQLVYFALPGVP
ncbi:hypothetical protein B0H17DRAFT_1032215 [Mycena rosella]|uniref:Uncharacterized protein n=1 Tax=Mycena rosella TaxID=1033263 RepID=A0AAD7GZH3_MYCRO|nr:hypothetical protein B0H17DRAFT_1032215 [Mycena rosella]